MITGIDDPTIMMKCFDEGADEFIKKPFTHIEILTRVNAMLKIKMMRQMSCKRAMSRPGS